MSITREKRPNEYVAPGGTFPEGPFVYGTPSGAIVSSELAKRIIEAMLGKRPTYFVAKADLTRAAVHRITTGHSVPSIETVRKLEDALGTPLYPTWSA